VAALTTSLRRWADDRAGLLHRRNGARARAEQVFDIRKVAVQLWDEYGAFLKSQ
jgi:hypothetical protein